MSTTFSLTGLLLGLLAIVAIVIVISFTDRDGLLFRTASKAIFPISKQFMPSIVPKASLPIDERLDRRPKGWEWFQPDLTSAAFAPEGLLMVPTKKAVWWKNKQGPLLFMYLSGDFEAKVSVSTRKKSKPESYPDVAFQFGGIMVRDPRATAWFSREDYVFVAVGYRGTGLQIEAKSTFNGYSDVFGTDWDTGDAQLRIRRVGKMFELFAYSAQTDKWRMVQTFERELPEVVQIGLFAYAYSDGKGVTDIIARFSDLEIQAIDAGSN